MKTLLIVSLLLSTSAFATDFDFPPTPQKKTVAHVSADILNSLKTEAPDLVSETRTGNDVLLTVTDGKTAFSCHTSETQIYDCMARGQEEMGLPATDDKATQSILYRALSLRAGGQQRPIGDSLYVFRFDGLKETAFNLFDGNYFFSCSEAKDSKAHSCQFQYFPDKEKSPLR